MEWGRTIRTILTVFPELRADAGEAGYVDGQPNILEATSRGESYLHTHRGYGVIGSG